jgi:hypothetical protein
MSSLAFDQDSQCEELLAWEETSALGSQEGVDFAGWWLVYDSSLVVRTLSISCRTVQ